MRVCLAKDPLRLTEHGLLICDDSILRDKDEPISRYEVERINEFVGKRVLKVPRWWRKTQTRHDAAEKLREWFRTRPKRSV